MVTSEKGMRRALHDTARKAVNVRLEIEPTPVDEVRGFGAGQVRGMLAAL